jgi:hypothetical protein
MVPRTLLANLEDSSKFAAAHAALEGYHAGFVGNGLTEKLVGEPCGSIGILCGLKSR